MYNNNRIYITFDRETWSIPAHIIAVSRAVHYACNVDGHKLHSHKYYQELKTSLEPGLLIEWAKNNMNWSDVRYAATLETENHDYNKLWPSADMEVK